MYAKFFISSIVSITLLAAADSKPVNNEYKPGIIVGTIEAEKLDELSGLAASRTSSDILWTHNDSGDKPQIYAISTAGKHLVTVKLKNTKVRDLEDIAIGPGPDPQKSYIYIGDTGDNLERRAYITVYRIPEPTMDPNCIPQPDSKTDSKPQKTSVEPDRAHFKYPEQPRDVEAMWVDPVDSALYFVTKRTPVAQVYQAKWPKKPSDTPQSMRMVAMLPMRLATAADISPDGKSILIRNYAQAYIWNRNEGEAISEALERRGTLAPLVAERQGEAVCFSADGQGYYTVSEKKKQPVYYFECRKKRPQN